MSWLVDMPSAGRWLLTLGVSAVFLLVASVYRRRTISSTPRTLHQTLGTAGQLLAYAVLAVLWLWTLEPIQLMVIRTAMAMALAFGLGSMLHHRTSPSAGPAVSLVNSAGMLLCILTTVAMLAQ